MDCKEITQEGRVVEIRDNFYKISIYNSACSTCKLKSVCPASKVRVIEVKQSDLQLNKGDKVKISMDENLGLKALFLSYILPFFVLLAVLILVKILTKNDGIAGLAALFSLVPYYWILHLLRSKYEHKFKFTIKPQK